MARKDAYIARLERMLGIVHRGDPDGRIDPKPLGESTSPSKILFKTKSSEENQKRQGGAKPGHPGHGRRTVAAEDADKALDIPCPDECPDCGGKLFDFGISSRTLRDCAPPRYVTIRLDAHEGWCPHCMKKISPPGPDDVLPHSATTVRCDAQTLADHYLHHMTVGTLTSQRSQPLDDPRQGTRSRRDPHHGCRCFVALADYASAEGLQGSARRFKGEVPVDAVAWTTT